MKKNNNFILISNPIPDLTETQGEEWRDENERGSRFSRLVQLSPDALRENTQSFLDNVSEMLNDLRTQISGFELSEVEISAVLTVSGKLSILGTGGEIGGEGGIKFTFKKIGKE